MRNQKDWYLIRLSWQCILQSRSINDLVLLVLIFAPVFLVSCKTENEEVNEDIHVKEVICEKQIGIITEDEDCEYRCVDIFFYSQADGMLQEHIRSFESDSIEYELWEGDYIFAAIFNSSLEFNDSTLQNYQSLEQMRYYLKDEDPLLPLQSFCGTLRAGENADIQAQPLICSVVLEEVTNNLSGYKLLENPRIFLEDICTSAEIFRQAGFRLEEPGYKGNQKALPCDIGLYTQHPGVTLFCYPNDSQEDSAGSPRTSFVFACEIDSQTYEFRTKLPPLGRNSQIRLSLTVDSTDSFEFKF